jgi:hypothetical protein
MKTIRRTTSNKNKPARCRRRLGAGDVDSSDDRTPRNTRNEITATVQRVLQRQPDLFRTCDSKTHTILIFTKRHEWLAHQIVGDRVPVPLGVSADHRLAQSILESLYPASAGYRPLDMIIAETLGEGDVPILIEHCEGMSLLGFTDQGALAEPSVRRRSRASEPASDGEQLAKTDDDKS